MTTRPRQFDLIAFDWDGTLFDSTQIITRCIQAAVVDVGGVKPTDEAASYVIGMALMPALANAAPDVPQDKYPMLGERYRFHYMNHANDIALFEGVLPLLAALRERHHWLAVATGKSRRGLDSALLSSGLQPHFDVTRCADETRSKPDPAMLEEILRFYDLEPQQAVMIGDTTYDMEMAQRIGMPAIGVRWGAHDDEALVRFEPRAIVGSVAELRRALGL